MMQRKSYCPKDSDFSDYYVSQIGSGFGDIRVVRAPRYQRGYGFGGFFGRLALPIIKYLGREALSKGVTIGKRVVEDPAIQQAFKSGVKELAEKGLTRIQKSVQEGRGRKRLYKKKTKRTKVIRRSAKKLVPKQAKKSASKRRKISRKKRIVKKRKDIFK